MSTATFSEKDAVGVIAIDNPPLNLLTHAYMADLDRAIDEAATAGIRVLVLRAAGRHFGAGADAGDLFVGVSARDARPQIASWLRTLSRLEQLGVPVIAQVQGMCVGGGLELALYCDLIVAGESATFGHPEANLGTATLLGGAQRIAERAGPVRARMFVYTADLYDAATCLDWGIIAQVVPDAGLTEAVDALAARIAAGPTQAHAVTKRLVNAYRDHGMAVADALLHDLAPTLYDTEDMRHSVSALIEHGARNLKETTAFVGR